MNWHLDWHMNAMQSNTTEINMYEYPPFWQRKAPHVGEWIECIKFADEVLMENELDVDFMRLVCKEGVYILSKCDIIDILKTKYPENYI